MSDPQGILKLGRYSLLEKLGQGSMGVVYRGYDEGLERFVAVKTMNHELNSSEDLRKRFHREASLAAKLRHPNIITIYDFGEEDGRLYIAMELLDGNDLKSVISKSNTSLEVKLDWMVQLCRAFGYAHRHHIVHRDIKPSNIQIRANGRPVVTDFGIARAASSEITRKGVIMGTPEYIAPEQILELRVDHRADIFSLGLLFYEMLTGTHPFRADSLAATAHKILNEKAVPPESLNPSIPQAISAIVRKAIDRNVNSRYQSCEDMLQDLLLQTAGKNH
jgi:serine/threonine protein kinase